MRLVMVYWIDAGLKMGWQAESIISDWAENPMNFLCTTVGLVHQETEEYIVLIQGTTSEEVLNPIRIRKDSIIGIEEWTNGSAETSEEAEFDEADSGSPRYGG